MDTDYNSTFAGFTPDTFKFLLELEFNNNKSWFEEHRQNYFKFVVEPFKLLVRDLSGFMQTVDPGFETRPDIGRTISRIYRDVRFSKNKAPYKTSAWITFRRVGRDWTFDPCFFFEITPHIYRYGMGFYSAPKQAMDRMRELIDANDPEFAAANEAYRRQNIFLMEGDRYKKLYNVEKPEEILEWYQRKNIYFMCTRNPEAKLFSSKIAEDLKNDFKLLIPLYNFLWKIKTEGESKE